MNNHLVSVIIPIYNIELYLERCVRSVRNQTYSNLEIILINDGSPDNCPAICEQIAKEDNRVIVIHQENKGCGAARNAGLKIFKGEWVCFIDGDDWIEINYIEELLKAVVTHNCLMCACKMRWSSIESEVINPFSKITVYDWRKYVAFTFCNKDTAFAPGYSPFSVCTSLYNRRLFKYIRFTKYNIGQDIVSAFLAHSCVYYNSKIAVTNLCLYTYFERPDSAMRAKKGSKWLSLLEAFDELLQYFKEKNELEVYNLFWGEYFYYCVTLACEFSRDIPERVSVINSVINRVFADKQKAYNLTHNILVRISAKYNWEKITNTKGKIILYGFGRNGKKLLDWLLYFDICVYEVWDISADNGQYANGVPLRKIHDGYAGENTVILCSIESPLIYNSVFHELRQHGYENIIPFETLDEAVKYAVYNRFLPFLLEDIDV